jgi:hypothetical protein
VFFPLHTKFITASFAGKGHGLDSVRGRSTVSTPLRTSASAKDRQLQLAGTKINSGPGLPKILATGALCFFLPPSGLISLQAGLSTIRNVTVKKGTTAFNPLVKVLQRKTTWNTQRQVRWLSKLWYKREFVFRFVNVANPLNLHFVT